MTSMQFNLVEKVSMKKNTLIGICIAFYVIPAIIYLGFFGFSLGEFGFSSKSADWGGMVHL